MTSGRRVTALAGMLASLMLVAGCGNAITTEIIGATGASLDRSGSPRLPLAVCSGSVDGVELYGPHQGGETTPQGPIGIWKAKEAVTADTVLNLKSPGPGWTVERDPGTLKPGVPYVAFGGSRTEDQEISQVAFTLERLRRLSPHQVLYHNSESVSADALHATVCH